MLGRDVDSIARRQHRDGRLPGSSQVVDVGWIYVGDVLDEHSIELTDCDELERFDTDIEIGTGQPHAVGTDRGEHLIVKSKYTPVGEFTRVEAGIQARGRTEPSIHFFVIAVGSSQEQEFLSCRLLSPDGGGDQHGLGTGFALHRPWPVHIRTTSIEGQDKTHTADSGGLIVRGAPPE